LRHKKEKIMFSALGRVGGALSRVPGGALTPGPGAPPSSTSTGFSHYADDVLGGFVDGATEAILDKVFEPGTVASFFQGGGQGGGGAGGGGGTGGGGGAGGGGGGAGGGCLTCYEDCQMKDKNAVAMALLSIENFRKTMLERGIVITGCKVQRKTKSCAVRKKKKTCKKKKKVKKKAMCKRG
jgi:hypothetical protein